MAWRETVILKRTTWLRDRILLGLLLVGHHLNGTYTVD